MFELDTAGAGWTERPALQLAWHRQPAKRRQKQKPLFSGFWLGRQGSNLDHEIQSLACCRLRYAPIDSNGQRCRRHMHENYNPITGLVSNAPASARR